MDTTQLLYLAGAFLLGFFFAWFMGRSGPKRALEESEANANALKRKVDDGARASAKLEDQLKQQSAQVDRLGSEKAAIAAQIATYEQSAADSAAELAQLQQQLSEAQAALSEAESERLRLEAELGHMRDAYADTRSRFVEVTQQAEADRAAAEAALVEEELEAIEAEEIADDVTTALALAEESYTAEVSELTGQVQSLETELAAARAALSRMSAQVALRPELTAGKRQEYAALAGDQDKVIAALHERDIAVVDARGEVDYLRRTIGMLTAMGAELANEVERRRREQQLLAYQVAGLTAEARNVEMKQIADKQAEVPAADLAMKSEEDESLETRLAASSAVAAEMQKQLEEESAAAAELRIQLEERSKELEALKAATDPLQANLDELQAEIEALNAAKADLEAQAETRDTELTETKDKLVGVQTDVDSTAAAKAGLEQQLQAQTGEWDALLARINALNDELAVIISAGEPAEEPAVEEPAAAEPSAEAPAETPAADVPAAAPSAEVAALATASEAAETAVEIAPEAARAADAAIPVDAGQASEQPAAQPAQPAQPAPEQKEESPASVALAKLSAGVAAAVALLKRKNAKLADYEQQVGALSGDKNTLESTVAAKDQALVSTQGKVEELQNAMTQRSARFDALSMHASGLEAELEIQRMDRTKLDEQVRQVATDLQGLTATYGVVEAAPAAEAPADVPDAAAPVPVDAAPAEVPAEAPAAAGSEVQAEAAAPAEAPAAAAPVVEVTSSEALTASAAAVAELVRSKQGALDEAKAQLASLQEELASYTAAKEALAAELESRGLSLSDVQAQLQAVQGDYAGEQGARGELESKLQSLDVQLQDYLAEYGDAEEAAASAEAAASTGAEAAGEVAAEAPADAAALAIEAEAEPVKADAAARLAALGLVLKRRKEALESANGRIGELEGQINELTAQGTDLQAQIQEKEQALADLNTQYAAAQADVATAQTRLQELDTQLEGYVAEFADPEDAAIPAEAAPEAPAAEGGVEGSEAEAPAPAKVATVATLGAVLKRRKEALDSATSRIGELEAQVTDLAAQKADLEGQVNELLAQKAGLEGEIQQKEQALADLNTHYEASQADAAQLTTDIETLKNQLDAVQAELKATEEERQRLDGQLTDLNTDLSSLAAAWDAGDESTVTSLAEKLMSAAAPVEVAEGAEGAEGEAADGHTNGEATREMAVPLAKTAGAVAVAGAIRKKQQTLEETTAQLDSAQQEQAALTTAKADLEAQLAALQAKYDEAEAARTQLQGQVDELTAEQEAAKALLAERDSAVLEAESKLEAITLPVEKTLSDFKAAARAAAEARGVELRSTSDVQDLAELKHIGVTFEQRLYRAGAGTYWEVAHMTDDDFELVLRLTEMQKLAMDMSEVRSDAVRLAEESNTVGLMSAGDTPDDFEPIQGIGKIFEQRLYSAGIRTYRELANTSEERLAEICQARKPLVPDYGSWIRQARMFMEIRSDK